MKNQVGDRLYSPLQRLAKDKLAFISMGFMGSQAVCLKELEQDIDQVSFLPKIQRQGIFSHFYKGLVQSSVIIYSPSGRSKPVYDVIFLVAHKKRIFEES